MDVTTLELSASKISNYFHGKAKSWLILTIFAIFVLFVSISLPVIYYFYPTVDEMVSLDDPIFYTPEEIFSIVESWGEAGRTQQFWFHLTWDFIVPVLALLFIGLFISWLTQRGFNPKSKMQKMNLIALAAIFDLLENLCIEIIVMVYPSKPIAIAWFKSIFTMAKYSFGVFIILIILISLIKAIKNKFKIQAMTY